MDYHKLKQVVTLVAAVVPEVVSLLEQITHPLVPGMQPLSVNCIFLHFCQ